MMRGKLAAVLGVALLGPFLVSGCTSGDAQAATYALDACQTFDSQEGEEPVRPGSRFPSLTTSQQVDDFLRKYRHTLSMDDKVELSKHAGELAQYEVLTLEYEALAADHKQAKREFHDARVTSAAAASQLDDAYRVLLAAIRQGDEATRQIECAAVKEIHG